MATLLLLGVSACTGETSSPPPTAKEFQATLPTSAPLTADEIQALLDQLASTSGKPPAREISASVFTIRSSTPDESNPDWVDLIKTYGDKRVRDAVHEHGWRLVVTGYTDSSGTADYNLKLSQARADATRGALIKAGYAEADVLAKPGGIGGPDPSDRRVEVRFERKANG